MKADRLPRLEAIFAVSSSSEIEVMCLVIEKNTQVRGAFLPSKNARNEGRFEKIPLNVILSPSFGGVFSFPF